MCCDAVWCGGAVQSAACYLHNIVPMLDISPRARQIAHYCKGQCYVCTICHALDTYKYVIETLERAIFESARNGTFTIAGFPQIREQVQKVQSSKSRFRSAQTYTCQTVEVGQHNRSGPLP